MPVKWLLISRLALSPSPLIFVHSPEHMDPVRYIRCALFSLSSLLAKISFPPAEIYFSINLTFFAFYFFKTVLLPLWQHLPLFILRICALLHHYALSARYYTVAWRLASLA